MTISGPPFPLSTLLRPSLLLWHCSFVQSVAEAVPLKAPTLISAETSTRAIALESVTLRAEPFPLTSSRRIQH